MPLRYISNHDNVSPNAQVIFEQALTLTLLGLLPCSFILAMFYQIVSLLLEVAAGVLTGACLLRLYMQYLRIPMSARSGNPLGRFVFALTDWIVLPLRRILPSLGALDTASLVAAFVLQLIQFGVLWLLAGGSGGLFAVPILAGFGLVRTAISGMTGAVIIYAVMSWVQANSVIADVIERLVSPPLTPIRRVIPLVGGVDLSVLVLLVILQIVAIVLGHLQASALMMF
jgi:YggT family protein